jgi:hypothetical protein
LKAFNSTHLEVFFENFVRFFHFLNLKSNFEFGSVENWPEPDRPVRLVPTVSGPVPTSSVNRDLEQTEVN